MVEHLKRQSLTEQASEAIVDLIAEKGLKAGDFLPPTGELATSFNVSVPVIREAIAGLSSIGLLQKQQGRESVISTPGASHLGRLFGLRIVSEEIDDVALQQYREIMEVGNARLAARNRTTQSILELEDALHTLRNVDSEEKLHAADVAFHAAVADAGGNDLIILTLTALQPLLRRQRERVWHGWVDLGGDLQSIIEAHATVLQAIRRGDEDSAAAAMAAHLGQARVGLEHDGDQPGRPAARNPFKTGS